MSLHLPPDRRVIRDLKEIGFPEVPLFGAFKVVQAEVSLPPHTHGDCMEIHYIHRGLQTFSVGEQLYTVRGGDLFITQPHESHGTGINPLRRGVIYWLQLRVSAHPRSLLGLNSRQSHDLLCQLTEVPVRHFRATPRIADLFEEMYVLLGAQRTRMRNLEFSSRLVLWLATVVGCSHAETQRHVTAEIRSVLARIDMDPRQCPPVPELAKGVGLPLVTFQRRFKAQVGVSPHTYVLDRKIAMAANWLGNSQRDVTDIANDLGFSSSQHFATVFKYYTGMSPLAYRNKEYPKREYPPEERVVLHDRSSSSATPRTRRSASAGM
jgi:AraC-like DNA-binding protein